MALSRASSPLQVNFVVAVHRLVLAQHAAIAVGEAFLSHLRLLLWRPPAASHGRIYLPDLAGACPDLRQ